MSKATSQLFKQYFKEVPSHLAFAPGRIEFIGNHTDYNGGLVMGAAISEGITVAVNLRKDAFISIVSESRELFKCKLGNYQPIHGLASWINYPIGVTDVMTKAGMQTPIGYNMAVTSTLPIGAGMSSSAAFELASAYALAALYGFEVETLNLARIARKAENEFVGMPCGILDQGVSAFGRVNHLVRIDCSTEQFRTKPIPEGSQFWIFDTNKKHSLIDSAYTERHKQCLDALVQLQTDYPMAKTLSEINIQQLAVSKDKLNPLLYKRAYHIVSENARVRAVERSLDLNNLESVGKLLYASHESSIENFENSMEELDSLVELLKPQNHVYGARLTGGGFGGAVMAMTNSEFDQSNADVVSKAFVRKYGIKPTIFRTCAGEGARILK